MPSPHIAAFGVALILVSACSETSGPAAGTGGTPLGGTDGLGSGGVTATGGSGSSGSGGSVGGATGGSAAGGDPASGGAGAGPASTGGSGNGGGDSAGGSGTGGQQGSLGTVPTPDCDKPADLGVRMIGRHDGCVSGGVQFAWSGAGFVARFAGTGLSFTQDGPAGYATVVVDGVVQADLVTQDGEHSYAIASGLPAGEHVASVYRQGEASFGTTLLLSVTVADGSLLPPPPAPERHIEIFGDSITAGYGNEGDSTSCSFSAETENHYLTYGALLARSFGADLSTVAWSGKGVVVNYGGDTSTTLPEMADRANPHSTTSVWDYTLAPPPDLVLINLGTNDFSTESDPSHDAFVAGYQGLLEKIRARYPDTFILCTVGPLLTGSDLDSARAGIDAAVAARKQAGDAKVASHAMQTGNPDPGCDWHPSLATHQAMATELSGVITSALGW